MPEERSSAGTRLLNPSWVIEHRHCGTLFTIVTFLVVVGVAAAIVGAATTEIGFEAYDDGTELTAQYENVGIVFEPQGDESAGAIVTTCGPNTDVCTAARAGENVIQTPTSFEVEHRPLAVRFTEPKQEVALYVREFAWYDGSLTARLIARDSGGDVVARSGIQFDAGTGWHRITVSTAAPDIALVTLTMTDTGQTQEHNYFVVDDLTIRVNEPPTPAFSSDPDEPRIDETVKFDASPSTDVDGEIVEYRWDFNGDGSVDETTQRSSAATTFDEPGRYTVTLEVEDDEGATSSIVRTLTVAEGPAARCSISDSEVAPGEQVVIDASESLADRVRFDIDGDGRFDRTNDDTFRELVRYSETGAFTPVIRVELGGESDTVQCGVVTVATTGGLPWVDVAAGGIGGTVGVWFLRRIYRRVKKLVEDEPNNPPLPSISYTPRQPSSIRPVLLDGSTSTDPDPEDRIVSYQWTIEDNELTVPRFVHAFLEAGEYDVELQVTDSHGAIGRVTETITVEDERGEFALAHVHPDAPGNDHENLHQEYIVFENTGNDALDISGWTIHDAAEEQDRVSPGEHTFEFPDDTIIEQSETIAVHTGSGPATGTPTGDTNADHTLFWGSNRAVWNNEADAVVVQDDQDNPVTAVRYERNDAGDYEIEPLDVETLADWFPADAEMRPDATALSPLTTIDRIRAVLSNVQTFVAGCIFLRGPRTFLVCWATITGFLIAGSLTWGASTSIGVVTPTFEPIVLILLVSAAVVMLLVGVVWLLASITVSSISDRFRSLR